MKKKMKPQRGMAKYVDAMAIKDGYLSSKVPPEELFACNAKYSTLEGPYEFEAYAAMKGKAKAYDMEDEED